jgi:hypothetical protein
VLTAELRVGVATLPQWYLDETPRLPSGARPFHDAFPTFAAHVRCRSWISAALTGGTPTSSTPQWLETGANSTWAVKTATTADTELSASVRCRSWISAALSGGAPTPVVPRWYEEKLWALRN